MDKPREFSVKIIPDATVKIPYPRFYSNIVSVHPTPFDVTLRFCEALPAGDLPAEGEVLEMHVPITCEVVIPTTVFSALVKAMQETLARQQESSVEKVQRHEKKKTNRG